MKKINIKEVEAALEGGDEDALNELSGPDPVEIKKTRDQDEADGEHQDRGKTKRKGRGNFKTSAPMFVEGEVKMENQKSQKREPTPFMLALRAAQKITTRRPKEEQPEEFELLQAALGKISEEELQSLVWRLVKDVLEDNAATQGLFPVARAARMMTVAYNTAIVKRVIQEGVSFHELREAGLVELKIGGNGRPYAVYRVGNQTLASAAKSFREKGKLVAAKMLEEHLRHAERNAALSRFARDTKKTEEAAASEEDNASKKTPDAKAKDKA